MLSLDFSSLKLNKLFINTVSSSILATVGLVAGIAPEISLRSHRIYDLPDVSITLSSRAWAQQFTPEETVNYAKAGYEVELLRREVYQEIKTQINEPPPDIVCDQQDTLANLEPSVRAIAERYCTQSQSIVRKNNLSINRFNELKTFYDQQSDFYQQVQEALIKLQN